MVEIRRQSADDAPAVAIQLGPLRLARGGHLPDADGRKAGRGLTKWDCPHLYRLGAKHVLIVYAHPMRQNIYFVGRYEARRFHVEGRGNLDVGVNAGGAFSAAHPSYQDPHGRTVLVGMMQEHGQDAEAVQERGWSGAISLPRVLTLGDDDRLRVDPVAEIESLRGRHWQFTDIGLTPNQTHQLAGVSGACLEIEAVIDPGSARECRLGVLCGDNDREQTPIVYDAARRSISLKGVNDALDLAAGEFSEVAGVYRPVVGGGVRESARMSECVVVSASGGRRICEVVGCRGACAGEVD